MLGGFFSTVPCHCLAFQRLQTSFRFCFTRLRFLRDTQPDFFERKHFRTSNATSKKSHKQ